MTALEARHVTLKRGEVVSEDFPGRVRDRSREPRVVDLSRVLVLGEGDIEDRAVWVVGSSGHDLPPEAVVDLSIRAAGVPPAGSHLKCTLRASATRVEGNIGGWDSVGKFIDCLTVDVLLLEGQLLGSISCLVSEGEAKKGDSNKGFHS